MAVLVQCPVCRRRQSLRNKTCSCGQDLDKAKKNKRVVYWITYRLPGGKQRREKVGDSYKEASAADGKRRGQVAENKIINPIDRSLTFSKLAEWWRDQPKVKKLKSYNVLMINLNSFLSEFGNHSIYSITKLDLTNYQIKRKSDGKSDSYIDQEIGAARNMLNTAWEGERISGEALNPFRKIKKLLRRNSNARDIVLPYHDFVRLMEALPKYARDILAAAFYTGMRRGEILGLTWDRVDLENNRIELLDEHTKTDTKRYVPISESLKEIFNEIPRAIHTDHVFLYKGYPLKSIRAILRKTCLQVGIPYGRNVKNGITFHDLRHTFNTNMRKAGAHDTVTMAVTGHSTREMFDRYNTIDENEKQSAVNKMEKMLVDQNVDRKKQNRQKS